jgi:hypothetical protein
MTAVISLDKFEKSTRIVVYKQGVKPSDEKRFPELHAWMLARMDRFRMMFAIRIRSLSPGSIAATHEGYEHPEE